MSVGKRGMILGSEPLKLGAIMLDKYVADSAPTVPAELAISDYPYGMLGNDTVGDCVEAGMLHMDELFYLRHGVTPGAWTAAQALALYSAWGGYVLGEPSTDNGTDPSLAFGKWVHDGLTTVVGHPGRHSLAGFGVLDPKSPNIRRAIWEFGAVGLCYALPANVNGVVWTGGTDVNGQPADGHFVAGGGWTQTTIDNVCWGQKGTADDAFNGAYLEQVLVPLSRETLNSAAVGPAGFNFAQMTKDLPSPQQP